MNWTRRAFLSSSTAWAAGDLRWTEIAHPKTHFALRVYRTRSEWEEQRRRLRRQILSAAGLFPMPDQPPVPAEVVRRVRKSGYEMEVLLLETMPGYFVGATVYRPAGGGAVPRPAVLVPHGHWKRGRAEHLPSYSVPALGINLALQGYVAITWDMVGYNDTRQTDHSFGGWREVLWGFNPLGVQLWNSIRVLDYLSARTDVDAHRIACTGASGGGTQTILLAAVDDRVACSIPVNMVSAHYQGADPCEEAPNLRLGTNNVEIAAMAAPRPMLLISCTGDWTRNTPREEFPAVQRVYQLFGRMERAANAHFDAEHNYNAQSREAAYAFLAEHLLGKRGLRPRDVDVGEVEADEILAGRRPEAALTYDELFEQWIATSRRLPTNRESLRGALGVEWTSTVDQQQWGDYLLLSRRSRGDRVPAVWQAGRGDPVVVVHPKGRAGALAEIEKEARPALVVDVFGTGQADAERDRGGKWFLSYNQTDDAHRVQDIVTAMIAARQRTGRRVALRAFGDAAVWATFAAATAPFPVEVNADLGDFAGTDEEMRKKCYVPCIQRAGGLEAALRILGRRR